MNIKRITAFLLVLIIIFSLCSCNGGNYALKIGDRKVTPEQYKAAAISIKTQFLSENGIEETKDLWTQYIDTSYSATTQEYLDAMIQSYLIEYNLYAIHFDELGLTLPKEKTDAIEEILDEYVKQHGSKENLDEALKKQGFSYNEYKSQFENEAKKEEVILYYFGPNSTQNPTNHEEMKNYYDEYYTKVKHIFISTKDEKTNDYSVQEKEALGQKAKLIYDRAIGGEDFERLLDEYNEDPGMATNPDGYIFSTEDTSYTKAFHNAAFEMKENEIRLVQSNLGFHIMKRYPFLTEEISDPDMEITLIENMMSSELAEILEGLKERIGVTYNNPVLTNLSVVNIKTAQTNTENK